MRCESAVSLVAEIKNRHGLVQAFRSKSSKASSKASQMPSQRESGVSVTDPETNRYLNRFPEQTGCCIDLVLCQSKVRFDPTGLDTGLVPNRTLLWQSTKSMRQPAWSRYRFGHRDSTNSEMGPAWSQTGPCSGTAPVRSGNRLDPDTGLDTGTAPIRTWARLGPIPDLALVQHQFEAETGMVPTRFGNRDSTNSEMGPVARIYSWFLEIYNKA
jgi:hypothetical protein